jgi:hypothetical protein
MHHAPAAATLFNTASHAGYEYAGKVYDSKLRNDGATATSFKHAEIGMVNANGTEVYAGTGTSGPCAGCHMTNKSHSFSAISEVSGTTVIAAQAVCDSCHGDMTYAVIEEEKTSFNEATTLLGNYLLSTGTTTNYLSLDILTTANNNYKTVALDVFGAFQNYKYMTEEKGAFVHNRKYVRRLIFDSIDLLDNGVLDGTITIDAASLAAYPEGAAWLKADATTGVATRQ